MKKASMQNLRTKRNNNIHVSIVSEGFKQNCVRDNKLQL